MPNAEGKVHISLYVSPKLKKYIHMEAIRQDTWIADVVEELLWIAIKWAKKAEMVEREQDKRDTTGVKEELVDIQENLELATTSKRKRE